MTSHHSPPVHSLRSIGVDVMMTHRLSRALSRSPRLFDRLCAPSERAHLCTPGGLGLFWATFLWCTKEASVKCLGTGFWRANIDWPDLVIRPVDTDIHSENELERLFDYACSTRGLPFSVLTQREATTVLSHDLISGVFHFSTDRGLALAHREIGPPEVTR